ncbi:MAG: hypothetical protein SFW62_08160 [Alphaproteobacteria bacterium]|nr:hypothetical protein [Alphaproteobacteria bacterium]
MMPWYKCFVHGKDFPGILLDQPKPFGFYTTRFVKADTAEEAETLVLESLKKEKVLKLPAGYKSKSKAQVFFEEIEEVPASDVPATKGSGFTWY